MVEYIKRIADQLVQIGSQPAGGSVFDLIQTLNEELARLDPRDFLPVVRDRVALSRVQMRRWANTRGIDDQERRAVVDLAKTVSDALAFYGGEGSRAVSRPFAFVHDPGLRTIVERDYRELALILLPGGAWKSVVVMSGSILEAILYDLLTWDAGVLARATALPTAPKKDITAGKWTLQDLIQVSVGLGLLPAHRAGAIDQILRGYRNLVHPKKEVRDAHPCREAEALLSKGALDSVCDHLVP